MEHILAEMVAEVEELGNGLLTGAKGLDEAEEELRRLFFEKGNKLLSAMLTRGAVEAGRREVVGCEACGGYKELQRYSKKNYLTMFGKVEAERPYYYCPDCHTSEVPYDKKIGMAGRQISIGVMNNVSLCCADQAFAEAVEKLESLTMVRVSVKSAQLISERAGARMGKELEAEKEAVISGETEKREKAPEKLHVSADGTSARMLKKWTEVKCGAIFEVEEVEGKDGKKEIRARDVTYHGRLGNIHGFGEYLFAEAMRRGVDQAKEVIFLADGARCLWELCRTHFPGAVEILDWYHASEHVWDLAKVLFGEGNPEGVKWANEQLDMLYEGQAAKYLGHLKELKFRGKKKKAVAREIGYVENNLGRMHYDDYRKKGYQIGSGVVESSCKHLVGSRLKGAGMRWSEDGAQNILNLRIYKKNKRWQDFWQREMSAVA